MAQAGLGDQLGAMAIIDELRHRQMVVDEQLDLPQRRAEVAQRIRDYYAGNGIAVDEALIEEGIRAYFDHRLEFEAGQPGKFDSGVALAYIRTVGRPG